MSFTHERARVAALTRHYPGEPELAADARRRLKVIKAEKLIRALMATEPVLTLPERADLARMLLSNPGGAGGS